METCYQCGEEFGKLSLHWYHGSCSYPDLSNRQIDVLTGLLMGDGTLDDSGVNPRICVENTEPDYLKYLDSLFPLTGAEVYHIKTPEECAERDRKSGVNPSAQREDYSNLYRWSTKKSPELDIFKGWYGSGDKEFPRNIEMNPTIFKHWLCCDGNITDTPHIRIKAVNEIGEEEKIVNFFSNSDIPSPDRFDGDGYISWSKSNSSIIMDLIEGPMPGYEYKRY